MGKKIVFVIRHFMNGGAQHRTLNLASALCSEGYDVTITYNEDKVITDAETIKAEDRPAQHIYIFRMSMF